MSEVPRVLVIDDHYAAVSKPDQPFFDQTAFVAEYGSTPFSFYFCNCFDRVREIYSLDVLKAHLGQSPAPDAILLDVRFGETELFGLDLLRFISAGYPVIPVIMMTSTPRGEL